MNVSSGSGGRAGSQDFELNIAPIIDCITVLIAFIMISTSFISIGLLDAGAPAIGTETGDSIPLVNVELEVLEGNRYLIKLSGQVTSESRISANTDGKWNTEELVSKLNQIKTQWKNVDSITISAEDGVPYKDIIVAMDSSRRVLPAVVLGGF